MKGLESALSSLDDGQSYWIAIELCEEIIALQRRFNMTSYHPQKSYWSAMELCEEIIALQRRFNVTSYHPQISVQI